MTMIMTAYVQVMGLLADNKDQSFTIEMIREEVGERWPHSEFSDEEIADAVTQCVNHAEISRDDRAGNPIYRITARGLKRFNR